MNRKYVVLSLLSSALAVSLILLIRPDFAQLRPAMPEQPVTNDNGIIITPPAQTPGTKHFNKLPKTWYYRFGEGWMEPPDPADPITVSVQEVFSGKVVTCYYSAHWDEKTQTYQYVDCSNRKHELSCPVSTDAATTPERRQPSSAASWLTEVCSLAQYQKLIREKDVPLLVYFDDPASSVCQAWTPAVQKAAVDYQGKVQFLLVDVNKVNIKANTAEAKKWAYGEVEGTFLVYVSRGVGQNRKTVWITSWSDPKSELLGTDLVKRLKGEIENSIWLLNYCF